MLCIALGLLAAVVLVMSVPLYANAANYRLLQTELGQSRGHPPFAFLYQLLGTWTGPVDWSVYRPADDYLTIQLPGQIGLPLTQLVRHVQTDEFTLFPASRDLYQDARNPLEWVNLGFLSGLYQHIEIVDGDLPDLSGSGAADALGVVPPLPVLVHENLANKLGLQPGERYTLFGGQAVGAASGLAQIPVQISGIWRPRNELDPYWLYKPRSFEDVLLTPEEGFLNRVEPRIKNEVFLAAWYFIFDGREIRTEAIEPFLQRVAVANLNTFNLLPDVSLDVSPVADLQEYQRQAVLLTILLYVIAIPIVALITYFVILVSGMVVHSQRHEIAVLRSRGTSSGQVVGIYLLEGLILATLALAISPLFAGPLAQVMGNTRSFLSFVQRAPLAVHFSSSAWWMAALAAGVAVLASLFPAISAARYTIVSYKAESARQMKLPFYQRAFVDLLLLAPALYGYYLLRQRGTISVLGRDLTSSGNAFEDPLLFLVPTFFLFALSLFFARLFPWLMRLMAWIAKISGASLVLAFRHLARSPGHYLGPLLLIVLTISLAAFTASMAGTIDRNIIDKAYYRVGADIRLLEEGEDVPAAEKKGDDLLQKKDDSTARWFFLPVSQHLTVPGVEAVARVGNYEVDALISGQVVSGRILGIDRAEFSDVAFFRSDFAAEPFGALMNALAVADDAVLVSRPFLKKYNLLPGDRLKLRVHIYGEGRDIFFRVAAAADYFPIVYPEDGPFFVCNLEYLFQERGSECPYNVLLKTDGRKMDDIIAGVRAMGVRVLAGLDARAMIAQEQARPNQSGAFGLLSIGFIASALLTVLGYLLHSILSFRERFIELGVLRAIGLSTVQLATFLSIEQLVLIGSGVGVGTALGVLTTKLFVPFFQVSDDLHPFTPPFDVRIAWGDIYRIYAVFGVMLVAAIVVLVLLLRRIKISQAIKLGEIA